MRKKITFIKKESFFLNMYFDFILYIILKDCLKNSNIDVLLFNE